MKFPARLFYFIRHGQTDANAQSLMCGGGWDIDLNEIGRAQAGAASELIARVEPPIQRIFVSPLRRAQQTAALLNAELGAPLETLVGIEEWRVGEWERRPWAEVPNPFDTPIDPPGGETRVVFETRVAGAVARTLEKVTETVLFVSHGAAAHALFTVLGVDPPRIENAALYRLQSSDGVNWTIEKVAADS